MNDKDAELSDLRTQLEKAQQDALNLAAIITKESSGVSATEDELKAKLVKAEE